MIIVYDSGEESGTFELVDGELKFYGKTREKADGLEKFVLYLQRRKRWTNEEVIEFLPKYLTGRVSAGIVPE